MPPIDVLPGQPLTIVADARHRRVDGPAPYFHLRAATMSYVVAVTRFGHLETVHVGRALGDVTSVADLDAVRTKRPTEPTGVEYHAGDPGYCLDLLPQDWSGYGKGDHRPPAAELRMPDDTFVHDFTYVRHAVTPGPTPAVDGLPTATGDATDCATLVVTLADSGLELDLHYTVWPRVDVVTRRSVLRWPDADAATGTSATAGARAVAIRRLMSLQVDLPNRGFDLVTFDGGWLREAHRNLRPVAPGTYVNASHSGFSGNQHNPGVLLATRGAGENRGEVYGFNLVYSGNHHTSVDLSERELVRVQSGINPVGFEWRLPPGGRFETPEAVLSWSDEGFNGLSDRLHRFVGAHVVRGEWATRERPVVLHSWEALSFDVHEARLERLARHARALGAEVFVLDDGWFGARDDATAGLGDYHVNTRKLPHGLERIAACVRRLGMSFGLWFEPESVNPDSDLHRAHPEWAVTVPGRAASEERHQLLLDLTRADVRDHIVGQVGQILDAVGVAYVKWDANRSFSDMHSATCPGGEFGHRYVLGLYEVLRRIFEPRPHILLETCASGGNRFDLGLLCFGPQVWASDNTDPIDRLPIQLGLSYLYPQSTVAAHVADSPSQHTLRCTPLSSRFNVAALGVLGYELDPGRLTRATRAEMARQVAFYKEHRRTAQFGRLRRHDPLRPGQLTVSISDAATDTHLVGHFQTGYHAALPPEWLQLPPLDADRRYRVRNRPQATALAVFGRLVEHLLPDRVTRLGPLVTVLAGLIAARGTLVDVAESYTATGGALRHLQLAPQYEGRGWSSGLRLLGDHGSRLYVIEPV